LNEKLIWGINILLAAVFLSLTLFMSKHPPGHTKASENAASSASDSVLEELLKEDDWALILINEDNPLGEDYTAELAELAEIAPGRFLDKRAAPYARKMIENAANDGIKLNIISAYRDFDKQTKNFDDYVSMLLSEGYPKERAISITASQIAHPGASEHNAGLALDIVTPDWWDNYGDLTAEFDKTAEFDWLRRNAYKYGFIMRYPEDKEDVTGIVYEPWHYRFVGSWRAEQMRYSALCLEEYLELIAEN